MDYEFDYNIAEFKLISAYINSLEFVCRELLSNGDFTLASQELLIKAKQVQKSIYDLRQEYVQNLQFLVKQPF